MRVVHVTTVHPPLDPRIFSKECRTLAAAGFDVTLAAVNAPAHRIDGVAFVRLPTASGNRLRRMLLGKFALLRQLRALGGDVYHFHDPELLPLLVVLRVSGKRVIYDAHEHLRDSLLSKPYLHPGVRRVIAGLARIVEAAAARCCVLVVAATPTIARQFSDRRTVVVHNYPILEELGAGPPDRDQYMSRELSGVYVGALTQLRFANEMFSAADIVKALRPTFRLVVAGEPYQVDDPNSHAGVRYLGVVPSTEVSQLVGQARFGLVLLANTPAYADGLPTKFFEYAAAGLPVVASSSAKAIAAIVNEHSCGILVDGGNPTEVASAISWLLEHPDDAYAMGQRGANVVRSKYSWALESRTLVDAYRRVSAAAR